MIGPPDAPAWPTLPGAREEAHRIADLCRDRGYKPTLLVNASSRDVQTEVFASDARVLHIAAHGQYSDNPFESGVVIGDNEYFTTANVAAMRRVPEFVFLNCCHLGQLGPDTKPATAFPALAASLAEGFMSAGVRAVIAAGWTVDDAAGLKFARTFYEAVPRRRAVRRGRPRGTAGDARASSRPRARGARFSATAAPNTGCGARRRRSGRDPRSRRSREAS